MKLTVGDLKDILYAITEASEPTKIGPSVTYMSKERVREMLQTSVISGVQNGEIVDEASLKQRFSDVKLALTALESIPFEVWSKLASK